MISILLPSRGRPDQLKRMAESAIFNARNDENIEIIARIDEDDPNKDEYLNNPPINTTVFTGERVVLSELWNECYERSSGNILMHAGDDIIFKTPDWDFMVLEAFSEYPDNIVFVYGNDGSGVHDGKFGTHGFIHRDWAEAVGYFVPPFFSSDYNDTWLNDVAKMIGRHQHIPIMTEHMHPDFKKGEFDLTHQERVERHKRDNVASLYDSKYKERRADADKLRRLMV